MPKEKNSSDAFTGLEAAIVLIAFVVVAAVFSYVILGAGFYTTQKAQETVYKGVEQATTNVQMVGNVYGLMSSGSTVINSIKFSINLAPGAPSVDLRGMNIVYAKSTASDLIIITHGTTDTPSYSTFTAFINGISPNQNSLDDTEQIQLTFKVEGIRASETVNFEIRPGVGAALPFSKTAPASLKNINILS